MSGFRDLKSFVADNGLKKAKGPIAIILIEDDAAVATTLSHHLKLGFRQIIALSSTPLPASVLPLAPAAIAAEGEAPAAPRPDSRIINLKFNTRHHQAHVDAVNLVIDAVPEGTWLYYCYNAEFLFFPFSESRSVGEMLAFHAEERRRAMLTYVVDLYAPDLARFPDAVSLSEARFDKTGYYALGRRNREGGFHERQLDFFGGLRWRFEEHLPTDRRRIDRIALFRSAKGLKLLADHRFDIEEYNTYSCPWHHNLTGAITSFRVAKALAQNPGSRAEIRDFNWKNSIPFRWNAMQLMDLGLMEPGQWF